MAEEQNQNAPSAEDVNESANKSSKLVFISITATLVIISGIVSYLLVQQWFDDIYKAHQKGQSAKTELVEYQRVIVNIGTTQSQRILMLSITLEVRSASDAEFLRARRSQFYDMIHTMASRKRVSELITLEGREELRNELIFLLNERLPDNSLINLYFSEYVIQ